MGNAHYSVNYLFTISTVNYGRIYEQNVNKEWGFRPYP